MSEIALGGLVLFIKPLLGGILTGIFLYLNKTSTNPSSTALSDSIFDLVLFGFGVWLGHAATQLLNS
jgi:hypothetical protein